MVLLFYNFVAIQEVSKQFGLKKQQQPFTGSCIIVDIARVALMFKLLQYYSSQEKYRSLCGSAIS